jgi:predicted alpha/beta-hydrolase family hydrolase
VTQVVETEERFAVHLPSGPVEVSAASVRPGTARATVVIAHGAGAGYRHPFLAGFARGLGEQGLATLRFNFPYLEAGRRMPGPAAHAVAAWSAAIAFATEAAGGAPVWASGKSYGGRMASMAVAGGLPARGLVFLGYPLHAPGKTDRVRDEHLYGIEVPMLFLQGTRDPFADPDVLARVLVKLGTRATHVSIEGGGHSFERSRKDDPREVGASLAAMVAAWIAEEVRA